MNIVVVGLGYVGLSNAVLLAQNNNVKGVDISIDKIEMINKRICPIEDKDLQLFLNNSKLKLDVTTDLDNSLVKKDYVIIATPTNYDEEKNYFDTSSVEEIIAKVTQIAPASVIVIKSTVPVGFVDSVRKKYQNSNIFSLWIFA